MVGVENRPGFTSDLVIPGMAEWSVSDGFDEWRLRRPS